MGLPKSNEDRGHTPGPWHVGEPQTKQRRVFMPDDCIEIRSANNRWLVACLYRENFYGSDEANARLIGAAPELLAALRDLASPTYQEAYRQGEVWAVNALPNARAVILKVEAA